MSGLDLLAGEAQAFVDDAWASHAHVHKADIDELTALLSLDDVDALLTSSALRTPALRVAKDGAVLPKSRFTRQATIAGETLTGLVDARKVVQLFDQGATLVLQGLHRYWPPLTLLIRDLERTLGHRCQANAYLTPPGSQGFALHSDTHDVFVFQTFGTKQWEIHDRGKPIDVLMEPGTSMYLPTGTLHAARTQETASLHVTVGINQSTYRDALHGVLTDVLRSSEYDERFPAGWLDEPGTLATELAAQLRRLADALTNLDPHQLADQQAQRFLSTRPSNLRGAVLDRVDLDTLEDDSTVIRRPGAVSMLQKTADSPDGAVLLLGDRELKLPAWVASAVAQVMSFDDQAFQVRDLSDVLDETSRLVLVRRLVREGFLRVTG
jgi:ribosomal protein L16 Arg81 hydroxylase